MAGHERGKIYDGLEKDNDQAAAGRWMTAAKKRWL